MPMEAQIPTSEGKCHVNSPRSAIMHTSGFMVLLYSKGLPGRTTKPCELSEQLGQMLDSGPNDDSSFTNYYLRALHMLSGTGYSCASSLFLLFMN